MPDTRIIKRSERRLGDAGQTAFLELLHEGEEKRVRTPRPAPAPRVEQEEESTPPERKAPTGTSLRRRKRVDSSNESLMSSQFSSSLFADWCA